MAWGEKTPIGLSKMSEMSYLYTKFLYIKEKCVDIWNSRILVGRHFITLFKSACLRAQYVGCVYPHLLIVVEKTFICTVSIPNTIS